MDYKEFFSLLLFIVVSIPDLIRAKFRVYFPVKYSKQKTVIALPYSPFCEKVFWAYDRCKIPYGTRAVFQGFFPTTLMEFSAKSVPIVVDDNVVYKDSKNVLTCLSEEGHKWLYPAPSVHNVECEFGDAFGKSVARIVYYHLFFSKEGCVLLKRIWKVDVSPFEQAICDFLFPAVRWAMLSGMDLPDGLSGFRQKVDDIFIRVAGLLSDGRKYLCGTPEMTAADVTFASLAYPLILPEEKAAVFLSWDDDLPNTLRDEVRRLRDTPAGKFVLRLYKEERHV